MSSRWLPRISRSGISGSDPAVTRDHQSYRVIVGNELSGDTIDVCDILDPGDGSGIASALAAASAGDDIFIRSGVYTLTASTAPLDIPADVRLIGAGPGAAAGLLGGGNPQTQIVGPDAGDQEILTMLGGSALLSLAVTSPEPSDTTSGGSSLITCNGGRQTFIDCLFEMLGIDGSSRTQKEFIRVGDKSNLRVFGCYVSGISGFSSQQGGGGSVTTMFVLPDPGGFNPAPGPAMIAETFIAGGDIGIELEGTGLQVTGCRFSVTTHAIRSQPNAGRGSYRDLFLADCNIVGLPAGFGASPPDFVAVLLAPVDADIEHVLINNCVFDAGRSNSKGVEVGTGGAAVRGCMVRGCAFRDFDLASIEVDATAVNTILGFNEMSLSTAKIVDGSVSTESAHNVV